jgi:environmental stress-induced protein Ves
VSWQVVHRADVPPSPWRNGGGVTRELLAWPHVQNWNWRMSVAEVARSGPFSRFEGVQRWFAVLSGAGVRLTLGAHRRDLTRHSPPFQFDGATRVGCELLDGTTQDFNLMVRGDRTAHMQRLAGASRFVLELAKTVAVYAIDAELKLELGSEAVVLPARSLAWRTLPAGTAVNVTAADALWMEIEP